MITLTAAELALFDDLREPLSEFPRVLRTLRSARDLSLDDLARLARIDKSHLWRFEQDQRRPTRKMVRRIADAFGLYDAEADALFVAAGLVPDGIDHDAVMRAIHAAREEMDR